VEGDRVILTPEGAAEIRRKLREQEAEIQRLRDEARRAREEAAELRRRLKVHENPNVPPSVLHHSPGFARERPLTPPEERKKPGPKPGHPGMTREPVSFLETRSRVDEAIGHWNCARPHPSLGYLTPTAYAKRIQQVKA
jgi:transposase InsO family protein